MLMVCSASGQQRIINLLEYPLLKSEKEMVAILKDWASGKQPVMQADGIYRSYSIDGPYFHIEYKVAKDSCLLAGIRFPSDAGQYNSFVRDV